MNCEVHILFTMDAELISSGAAASGPASDQEGALRIREYMEVLGEYGYKPTFFIHPELGEKQSDLFLELKEQGACLGLHIHTAKFAVAGHKEEMGALSFEQQKDVLMLGMDMFERYFGFCPEIFRPGCFSANDYTYKALVELGFKGGSICIPGRIWQERYCIWAGADMHPHYANENMRHLPGNTSFIEIPLSVDVSCLHRHPLGFDYYFDLRPGDVYTSENLVVRDHRKVLANIVRRLDSDRPLLKTIVVDVHNDRSFKDLSTTPAQHLKTVLDSIEPELEKYGMVPVNSTFDRAIECFLSKDK